MAIKKTVTKKMQVGGAAKKAMKTVPVKKTPVKEPKGQFIGGPDYPSKGMLYNDANRIATSKYFTPDGIRKEGKTLKTGNVGISADIGLNTELTAKKFMKANNMGKDGLPIKSKSSKQMKKGGQALPKAQLGKIVKMVTTASKTAGKTASKGGKKALDAVIDFRKAATKSDMSRAFSNIERADLKKQLQNFDKLKKNK
jgi:hypothetical protein